MLEAQSVPISTSKTIWRDPWFYRGIFLVPVLEALGFMLMVLIEPSPQVSFVLQIAFVVLILLAAVVVMPRRRRLGLGILAGWLMFVLFPVAWVLLLGFTGNLM